MKKLIKSFSKLFLANFLVWAIGLTIIVVVVFAANFKNGSFGQITKSTFPTLPPTLNDSATPVVISTPHPIQTPIYIQTPAPKTVYVDPDPVGTCNISPDCGGGTMQVRHSECLAKTCCQIRNSWSLFPTREACTKAQNEALQLQQPTKVIIDTNKQDYQKCVNQIYANKDICVSNCKATADLHIKWCNAGDSVCLQKEFDESTACQNNCYTNPIYKISMCDYLDYTK